MQKLNLQRYFTKGLTLLNKGIAIYIIAFAIHLILQAIGEFGLQSEDGKTKLIASLLIIPLSLINFSYFISTPVFFQSIQSIRQANKLNYPNILKTTLKNTKRLILPVIILSVAMFTVLAISIRIISNLKGLTTQETFQEGSLAITQPHYSIILTLLISIIISIFLFAQILFSLHNKSALSSITQSVVLAIKNRRFVFVAFLISATSAVILNLTLQGSGITYLVRTLLGSYISLWLAATALIYFTENIKVGNQEMKAEKIL